MLVCQSATSLFHAPENRANEVGIAALDTAGCVLRLTQLVETSRSFTLTLTLLQLCPPRVLVLLAGPDGMPSPDSGVNCVAAASMGGQAPAAAMPRAAFDDSRGFMAVLALAAPGSKAELEGGTALASSYLAFGAAGALLLYLEQGGSAAPAPSSLSVTIGGSPLHMRIDLPTMQALGLVAPLGSGGSCTGRGSGGGRGNGKAPATLQQLLNHTRTRAGGRLLRASLLQPLCDMATLNLR